MKKLLFTFMLMVFGFGMFAAPVSMETAQQVAVNLYKHYATKTTDYTIADSWANEYNGITTYYVFTFNAGGFVMVAGDDASTPILGYSTEHPFDKNNIPPNAQSWYADYSKQIKAIVDANVDNTATVKEWKKIQNNQFNAGKNINAVSPMLTTTWDQGCYYNTSCPAASNPAACNHVYTGCVATAMAQVMKFWAYPTTGVGTHTYTDPTYGSQTANFGTTTYNWSGMPNNVSSTNAAVATIMYHSGVSVNMQYGTSGSGAQETDIPSALINYFDYQNTAEIQFEASFTSANWITLLETELNAGRPVLYAGVSGTEGHSFVFDGYNSTNQFDINWGWSGSSDGYYTIGALNAGGYSFNLDNEAVVRVRPKSTTAPIANFTSNTTTPAVGGTVNFTDQSTNSPTTWTWTFDGGSPSTYSGQTPPTITYSTAGIYQVALTVSNTNGTDTKTSSQYIDVGGTGSKWILQNTAFTTASRGISCISIVNPYIVWAGAVDGTSSTNYIQEFTKTSDGGISWTPGTITFTGSSSCGIANLYAFNDTICYAAMFPGSATNGGYIAKTIDGGTTWSIANSPSYSTSWLDFVYFFNDTDGVCVGDPNTSKQFIIYTTSNKGNTWTQVPTGSIPIALSTAGTIETGITNQFDAVGDTLWYGTTQGRVYKTVNKGLNWTVVATSLGTSAAITPVFRTGNTGIVTGTNYSTAAYLGMEKTTDGGTTWNPVTPNGFYTKNPNLDYVSGTPSMWVDGSSNSGHGSSYSNDDCANFIDIDTGAVVQYTYVKFYDINTGWAGSFNTSATLSGGIYKWNPSVIAGIDNPKTNNEQQINIYPNPTNNFVNVKFTGITDKALVNVYNLVGEKVLSTNYNPSNGLLKLDLSANEAGIYFVTVDTGNNIFTKRIILVK